VISFIVPAWNEEAMIGRTLQRLRDSADPLGEPYEIIVVDDSSTDRTAEIAASHGALVVSVQLRHIAAVRNAGARHARGEALIFVDADTLVPEPTLAAAYQALYDGAIGGGAIVEFEGRIPFLTRLYIVGFMFVWNSMNFAAGCFVFTRRDTFDAAGGWDEQYFAGEEVFLSRALKKLGRFVILRERVISSERKARLFSE
jgi:glycosyltransferase involved in cell wall biosynthesis